MNDGEGEVDLGDPFAAQLWDWFWEISRGRQAGLSGWLPLSAGEIGAWCAITGNQLGAGEWRILRDMDATFLEASAGKKEPERPDISAAAFDAVFG